MIETGEEITVMGTVCGHVWPLSAQEVESIRKAFAGHPVKHKAKYPTGGSPGPPFLLALNTLKRVLDAACGRSTTLRHGDKAQKWRLGLNARAAFFLPSKSGQVARL